MCGFELDQSRLNFRMPRRGGLSGCCQAFWKELGTAQSCQNTHGRKASRWLCTRTKNVEAALITKAPAAASHKNK